MRIDKEMTKAALSAENWKIDAKVTLNDSQVLTLRLALVDSRCMSEAYRAIKERIENLRIPIAKAHYVALESIREANCVNMTAVCALPESSPGIADTEEFDQKIELLRAKNRAIVALEPTGSESLISALKNPMQEVIALNEMMIAGLEDKINCINEYESASPSFYLNAEQTVSGILAAATASALSYLATGSYGDLSWASNINQLYEDALDRLNDRRLKEASEQGAIGISKDGELFYYEGTAYDADAIPFSIKSKLVDQFTKAGFKFDLQRLDGAKEDVSRQLLETLGIDKPGTYEVANEKITFRGWGKHMTKQCNYDNRYHVKAKVIFEAEDMTFKITKQTKTVTRISKVLGAVGFIFATGVAFYDEYHRNPFYPTERRILNASIDAAAVGGVGTLAGMAGGAAAGATLGTSAGPTGAIIGGAVGGFIGGITFDIVYYEYLHDGVMRDVKDSAWESLAGQNE